MAMGGREALVRATEHGLFCAAGGFHIDPWRAVERAVITHAHSDHAVAGCGAYVCSKAGEAVLRLRMGRGAVITPVAWGISLDIGGVRVSLHPAGHILGSAQVRLEHEGDVWVVSGDYKRQADPTCDAFEPVRCRVFITESTFGLPIYCWPDPARVLDDLNSWWRANRENDRTTILYAYSLGKAQRVLAGLDPSIGAIALHGAVRRMTDAYEAAGVRLPSAPHASPENAKEIKGRGLIIAPPSAAGSPWVRKFAGKDGVGTCSVSGWMLIRGTRRHRSLDRGFPLSDHADWPGLMQTIEEAGAERIGVTHGYVEPLTRFLNESGRDAFVIPTRYKNEGEGAGEFGAEVAGHADADALDPVDAGPDPDGILGA
jgi:putative mRNA 3-end processing factor